MDNTPGKVAFEWALNASMKLSYSYMKTLIFVTRTQVGFLIFKGYKATTNWI